MNNLKKISLALLLAGLPKLSLAGPSKAYVLSSIEKAAKSTGVPSVLLKAICYAESNLVPEAYVFGDGGTDNHAFGMCQVLRNTAASMGSKDDKCSRDFRSQKHRNKMELTVVGPVMIYPRDYKNCELFGPLTNAKYAGTYLKKQLDRYKGSWIAAIAAYNSGSLKTCSQRGYYESRAGLKVECIPGAPINQKYVDRVLKAIYKFRSKRSGK